MGKFIKAKFNSKCLQTGNPIKKGDEIFYIPGRGSFCASSDLYKSEAESRRLASMIEDEQNAGFERFYQQNYQNEHGRF